MRDHLLGLITSTILPSSSTLYRHRLTLTIAYCKWMADINKSMMAEETVAWSTVDGSPQAGYNLLIVGTMRVKVKDLLSAMGLAQTLQTLGSEVAEKHAAEQLTNFLHMRQLIPVTTGSGRCSLKYKMHAWVHAERLQQTDWGSVAAAVSSNFYGHW